MWIVAKVKSKELNIFKKNLDEKFGNEVKFYSPKVEYHKYFKNKLKKFEKLILENYVFCFHQKFNEGKTINEIKFLKGLDYFLSGYAKDQNEIKKFISHCKEFENREGYLTPSFFKTMIVNKAKFISGPFTNMIFEVIGKEKNNLKILIGNIVTTISDKKDYLYRPI